MNLHEYQAKEIFARYGIPISPGHVAATPDEARAFAERLGFPVVIKAQVHSGGRGKAGGVKLASHPDETAEKARAILALTIQGLPVRQVLVTRAVDIASETYAGILLDRATKRPLVMLSAAGGVDIEETAHTAPEKILKYTVAPRTGLLAYQARDLMRRVQPDPGLATKMATVLEKLYRVWWESDASLCEINPLVVAKDGEVLALDAKMSLDDNALYRHPELVAYRDDRDESPGAVLAREKGLSYVKLDGDIGCIVNGAGLAMATLDLVQHFGGKPANFLDIGGSSNPGKMVTALQVITGDAHVRSILINIFGGITRCDDVARGLLTALDRMRIDAPIVIRLTGTNEKEARAILEARGFSATTSMEEAVQEAVARAQGVTV
ncbi:MAG TPA: ADP-forming succinate--CoA ligase subunit beta [Candidatus Eisenbacteria bacterium]|nr:ADP-forming succinate--CoA ligase subunit beta [Candidatus Eisenbacteria bacterium]